MDKQVWQCACGSHEYLEVWRDGEDGDMEAYIISLVGHPKTLWEKVVAIWRIIREGHYYFHEVVLDRNQVKELIRYIK